MSSGNRLATHSSSRLSSSSKPWSSSGALPAVVPASGSSPPAPLSKKLVGGSCLESPTTTADVARDSAPSASASGTCDASSNTTKSKGGNAGSRCMAALSGLASTIGFTAANAPPVWRISVRMERRGRCSPRSSARRAISSPPTWSADAKRCFTDAAARCATVRRDASKARA